MSDLTKRLHYISARYTLCAVFGHLWRLEYIAREIKWECATCGGAIVSSYQEFAWRNKPEPRATPTEIP